MNGYFERILQLLTKENVEFIVVGGFAARFHGSTRVTDDVDLLYRRNAENISRLARAVAPLHPRLRGVKEHVPFVFDEETIRRGLNFTLETDEGPLDCLGEIQGIGGYDAASKHAVDAEVFGFPCRFLSLDDLIVAKRSAARAGDLLAAAELEVIREERERSGT